MTRILPFFAFAAALLVAAPSVKADGSRWCAELSGGMGGSSNCGFETLEQCRETTLGQPGSFCRPNPFYKPSQEETAAAEEKKQPQRNRREN